MPTASTFKPSHDISKPNSIGLMPPEYFKALDILGTLKESGMIESLTGKCIASSEIIQTLLHDVGIESKMVEVTCVINRQGIDKDLYLIGFDSQSYPGEITTHVVLITTGPQPLLIDASLSSVLPAHQPWVLEKITSLDPDIIGQFDIDNIKITYRPKKNVRLPELHQRSIVERIKNENKFKDSLKTLKLITIIGVGLGVFNIVFNASLLILKILFP